MANGIDQFIGSLSKGGMRPTLFEVALNSPFGDYDDITFKCKATSVPAENIGVIEVPYKGRTAKIAGDRTYNEWTITIIGEEGLQVRKTFEEWMKNINDPEANVSAVNRPQDYMVSGTITTLSKDGTESAQYELRGVWPSVINEVALAWDSVDTLAEFDVTLQLQYFVRIK